ncbi:alcohol dehydrogenase [Aureobasidium sp. EXF-10727]|nr:alcohol dehydrogenase [Aureobasidium sp. EXF-10727]
MRDTSTRTTSGQYLTEAQRLTLISKPVPDLKPGEILIAPLSVTLCGSDIHYFNHGCNGSIQVREPLCLGHEFSGVIMELGPDVFDRKVGDRVAIEPGVACNNCELCSEGRYNICSGLRFRGSGSAWPHFQGGLQSRIIHPSSWTHKFVHPRTVIEEGALLEPLAVAVHACRRAKLKTGSSLTIIGAGAVGLLCAVAARLEGCSRVVIADIVEDRVEFALKNGFADAGFVVPTKRGASSEERLEIAKQMATSVEQVTYPDGQMVGRSDYTFECTGVESCVQASIMTTKAGGRVVLVGMGTPNHLLPISDASAREVDIIPVWRYANCYPAAIEIMQKSKEDSNVPNVGLILTHRYEGLSAVPSALECACRSRDDMGNMVIKVVVNITDPDDQDDQV